jgi:hypothetical protein
VNLSEQRDTLDCKIKIFIFRHAFYETGHKRKPISDEDIAIVAAIIAKNKTTSGFAAGDLADPHGTHEVCLNTI